MQLRHVETNDAVFGQSVTDHLGISALRRQDPAERLLLRRFHVREFVFAIGPAQVRRGHAINQRSKRSAGVGNDMYVRRPGGDRLDRIDIDPDQTDAIVAAPFDNRMKKAGADRERHVNARPEIVADLHGLGERMPDVERAQAVLTHDHRRLQHLGELAQLALGAERAAADEDRRVAGAAEERGRARDRIRIKLWRRGLGPTRPHWKRRGARGGDIGWNFHHHRTAAAAVQLPKRLVDDGRRIGGRLDQPLPFRHRSEHRGLIRNLVQEAKAAADMRRRNLSGDAKHRRVARVSRRKRRRRVEHARARHDQGRCRRGRSPARNRTPYRPSLARVAYG